MTRILTYHEFRVRYHELELLASDDNATNHLTRVYRSTDLHTQKPVTIFAHEIDIIQDDTQEQQKQEIEQIFLKIMNFPPKYLLKYDLVYKKDEDVVVIYYGVVEGMEYDVDSTPNVKSMVMGLYDMGDVVHGNVRLECMIGDRVGFYGVGMQNIFVNEEEDQLLGTVAFNT
jgi:hypothetical protein